VDSPINSSSLCYEQQVQAAFSQAVFSVAIVCWTYNDVALSKLPLNCDPKLVYVATIAVS